jgi:opacity protein-like surface antigen
MSALRLTRRLVALLLLWASPSLAQSEFPSGPMPAAKGPQFDVGVGYSHVMLNVSGEPTVDLNGADASATIDFNPRWGATVDSSYVLAGRDPQSGHGSYVLSVLAGPVFVPVQNDNTRLLVRALAGVSLVDGSVPVNQLFYRGWLLRFSWAVGTGVERNLSGPFAVRFNVDYLRTKFMSTTLTVQPQNDIRFSGSLVFRFAARRQTRHSGVRQP